MWCAPLIVASVQASVPGGLVLFANTTVIAFRLLPSLLLCYCLDWIGQYGAVLAGRAGEARKRYIHLPGKAPTLRAHETLLTEVLRYSASKCTQRSISVVPETATMTCRFSINPRRTSIFEMKKFTSESW